MSSNGMLGYGAKLFIGNPTTLTELTDILGVTPPNPTVETKETTNHASPAATKEFIAGLIDAGEISMKMQYVPGSAADTLILSTLASRAKRPFKIVVPGPAGTFDITGSCLITAYGRDEIPFEDVMTATLTAKVSGPATQAASA